MTPAPNTFEKPWTRRCRMGIDYIDLYQIHRPDFLGYPEHMAEVLTDLRATAKKYARWAHPITPSHNFERYWRFFPIATRQPEFSCWVHDALRNGTLDQCLEYKTTPLVWSPLAGGRLAMSIEEAAQRDQGQRLSVDLLRSDWTRLQSPRHSPSAVALAWTWFTRAVSCSSSVRKTWAEFAIALRPLTLS